MGKLFGYILTILISIVFGFWLAATHVLDGTQVGQLLYDVVEVIPVPEGWGPDAPVDVPEGNAPASETENMQTTSQNTSDEIDYAVIENRIFELLNELRSEVGVPALTKNEALKLAGDQRAIETETLFEHKRPDGREPFTVLEEEPHVYPYIWAGENLAMATYFSDEAYMADFIFNGWKDSPGHYENMVNPNFEEVGIGIHYDGEILYATQIFGTQR